MHEWKTRKSCEGTKCNLSLVLGNQTSTFLLDGECEQRAWLMSCRN